MNRLSVPWAVLGLLVHAAWGSAAGPQARPGDGAQVLISTGTPAKTDEFEDEEETSQVAGLPEGYLMTSSSGTWTLRRIIR